MTIVVAYVDAPEGRAALEYGAREARRLREDLVVVDGSEERAAVQRDVDDLRSRQPPDALKVKPHESVLGTPSDDVVQAAQQNAAPLIVIGVRHRSPVGKLLLGSFAQRVLLGATVRCWQSRPNDAPPAETKAELLEPVESNAHRLQPGGKEPWTAA